jgi:hypothetical protein
MNNQPTQKDMDERIPIMKSDYLHLLYRVEELERMVTRLIGSSQVEKVEETPFEQDPFIEKLNK